MFAKPYWLYHFKATESLIHMQYSHCVYICFSVLLTIRNNNYSGTKFKESITSKLKINSLYCNLIVILIFSFMKRHIKWQMKQFFKSN